MLGSSPLSKHGQYMYIIMGTDYVTKWAKARAVKEDNAHRTTKFLFENKCYHRIWISLELVRGRDQ